MASFRGITLSPSLTEARTTDLDFYLSEISVSDVTGGGLTLQRNLGADLDAISLFAHLHLHAQEYPATEKLRSRCLELPMWLRTPAASQWLGCRPSYWLRQRPFANRWYASRAAAKICARLPNAPRPLRGLICPQHVNSLYVTEGLRRRRPVEYITWLMDDHLVRWREGKWCYPPKIEPLFARHLRHARVVFAVSPNMQQFYQTRFGVSSTVLFGPAMEIAAPLWDAPSGPRGPCRLAYFGTVTSYTEDALACLLPLVEQKLATLDVFSHSNEINTASLPGVVWQLPIPHHRVVEVMREYDAIILPMTFKQEQRHLSYFCLSTKMSECIASGALTLAVGPEDASMMAWLRQRKAAIVVSQRNPEKIREAVQQVRQTEVRRSILSSAGRLAREELSIDVMQRRWRAGLAKLYAFS